MRLKLLISLVLMMAAVASGRSEPSTLWMKERAAARIDRSDWGQWWILNSNPNHPWFTDGDGADSEILTTASTIDISDNTNLAVDTDHLKLTDDTLGFSVNKDTNLHYWQGSFLEQFDFTISESSGTVTGSLEKEGTGDLIMFFSDEYTILDCTSPVCTVDLTSLVGTDTSPAAAFIYVPQSTKTLTAAASWPSASTEHIRVASIILQGATTTGTEGALMNRNWNDEAFSIDDPRGHGLHVGERLRFEHALWSTGVVLSITGSGTGTITLDTTAGTVYQLHLHTFPAIDMAGADNIHLFNLSGSEYSASVNLAADITTLANGSTSLGNNKYFNIVIWGVQNRSGTTSHLMCNLPTGQYTKQADAIVDASKFSVHTIPSNFRGTGFLIAELTFQFTSGPVWTLKQNKDLLGQTPVLVPGGGTTTSITTFTDSAFEVFDNSDDAKRGNFELSGITTGNTRTLTWPDTSSTIITSDGTTNFSGSQTFDAGATFNGDVHFDGVQAGRDVVWNRSTNTLLAKDNAQISYGLGAGTGDIETYWDGDSFEWVVWKSAPGSVDWNIGDEDYGFDVYFKSNTAGDYMWWDWSNKKLIFEDCTLQMNNDDEIIFGAGGKIRFLSALDELRITATSGRIVSFGSKVRMDAKLAFTQTDNKEYIDSEADGYMDYGATISHDFIIDANEILTVRHDGLRVAGLVRATRVEVDNNTTYIDKDGSNNMTFTDAVYGTKTLSELGSPTMVDVSASAVAEGNNNITSFNDKVQIKWIEITTASTDWTLTVYGDDVYSSHAREIVSNRSGNYNVYWDYPYEDEDATSEFHYNFTTASGAETHDIRVLGFRLI